MVTKQPETVSLGGENVKARVTLILPESPDGQLYSVNLALTRKLNPVKNWDDQSRRSIDSKWWLAADGRWGGTRG